MGLHMRKMGLMVLLTLVCAAQSLIASVQDTPGVTLPEGMPLPGWTYTYPLPEVPDPVIVSGKGGPGGSGRGGSFGGGSAAGLGTPVAKPPPLRVAELVPGFPTGLGYGLGDRLESKFVSRATLHHEGLPNASFSVTEGDTYVNYTLDSSNRILAALVNSPVTEAQSESRFAAYRKTFEQKLGAPNYGKRDGAKVLFLAWSRSDGSSALLALGSNEESLQLFVMAVNWPSLETPKVPGSGAEKGEAPGH